MPDQIKTDLCVIGAGPGGLSAASAVAGSGMKVVLVEKDMPGGHRLHRGCMPMHALIAAAERADAPRRSSAFGIMSQRPSVDFGKVHGHVQDVIAAIAPNDSKERFAGLGVQVVTGAARFKDGSTIAVGESEIRARSFVVATGAVPDIPDLPGLSDVPYLTNEGIFDLVECPSHLVVIGAGPIGLQIAQAYRRLGAQVTVIEKERPLGREDAECANIVVGDLARAGITIRSGATVERVSTTGAKVLVTIASPEGKRTIEGSHLLIATGRRANVDGLALEAAKVKVGPAGIVVDEALATSNSRVFAIGDVTPGPKFVHAATYHAAILVSRLLGGGTAVVNNSAIPWLVYTSPEIARVGMVEEDARREAGGEIRVLRSAYFDDDRAQAEHATRGHIKIVTDKTGAILGVTIVGAQACELITMWTFAIQQGLNVRALADLIVPYPSFAHIGKRAALSFPAQNLTGSWVRRIMGRRG